MLAAKVSSSRTDRLPRRMKTTKNMYIWVRRLPRSVCASCSPGDHGATSPGTVMDSRVHLHVCHIPSAALLKRRRVLASSILSNNSPATSVTVRLCKQIASGRRDMLMGPASRTPTYSRGGINISARLKLPHIFPHCKVFFARPRRGVVQGSLYI